jgi:polyisoprenoid-binding protein YceI
MAIRVDDVAATATVELRGMPTHLSLPLTSTGTDSWSWTYTGDGVDLSGTLVRTTNGLSWSATSGTIDLGAGPQSITPTSHTFDLLPTE